MPKSNIQCDPCLPGLDDAAILAKASLVKFAPDYATAMEPWWYWSTIETKPEIAWVDPWGRKIAGFNDGLELIVGGDYAALAHEMCHAAEWVKEGTTSEDHVGWDVKGFWKVIDDYQAQLAQAKAL